MDGQIICWEKCKSSLLTGSNSPAINERIHRLMFFSKDYWTNLLFDDQLGLIFIFRSLKDFFPAPKKLYCQEIDEKIQPFESTSGHSVM